MENFSFLQDHLFEKNKIKLHCCNEYQEFVEGLFQYQIEKEKLRREEYVSKDDQIRNQKAKHLAKERAEYR